MTDKECILQLKRALIKIRVIEQTREFSDLGIQYQLDDAIKLAEDQLRLKPHIFQGVKEEQEFYRPDKFKGESK